VHHCRLAEDRLLGERVPVLARREVHGIGGGDTLLQHTNLFQADGDPETAAGESRRVLEVTGGLAHSRTQPTARSRSSSEARLPSTISTSLLAGTG
jgi:hypothetical protein